MTATGERHGLFIEVEVSPEIVADAELARRLEEICPVDIFTAEGGRVGVVERNLDECVLCNLCVEAAPQGAVRIIKLYEA